MDYIIVNGEIVKKHETGFTSFFWDEPLIITQKLWFGFGGIPLFYENLENIKLVLNTLNIGIPGIFNDDRELFRVIKRMLNKNRFFRSGIISCRIYIGASETNTIITSFTFPGFDFPVSKPGLIVNFSEFEKYTGNPLNRFAFFNGPHWKFTEARLQGTNFNNTIFLNEKGVVCDCISANIFMIKGKVLYTPSVETGCYTDSLRKHILETARNMNLKIYESNEITKEDVIQMSEIFLASEENGIQWVLGVGNKRFVHLYSEKLHELLNGHLKKMIN